MWLSDKKKHYLSFYYGKTFEHSPVSLNQIRAYNIGVWDNPYAMCHGLVNGVNKEIYISSKTTGITIYSSIIEYLPLLNWKMCQNWDNE